MKNVFAKLVSAVKNEKGMELIQTLGLAAIAIVLVSVMYFVLNGNFQTWMETIDTGMTNLLKQFDLTKIGGGTNA